MVDVHKLNPFYKREEHGTGSLLAYKILTFISWLVVHIANIHYAWNAPNGQSRSSTIWGQNSAHPTPFSLNPTLVDIYWVVILVMQIAYMYHLWQGDHKVAAANVGAHFITNNLLMFGFVMLWVRGFRYFWVAELLLIINFLNLTALYFRHPKTPLLVHIPVISGPLAWTFVALFWCGAAAVNATGLIARIFANIAVWGWLVYGFFFLAVFKDWTMGFALSVLSACMAVPSPLVVHLTIPALGVHQFSIKVIALQWIFAFAIMSTLFVLTLILAIPTAFGKDISLNKNVRGDNDTERQPLLNSD